MADRSFSSVGPIVGLIALVTLGGAAWMLGLFESSPDEPAPELTTGSATESPGEPLPEGQVTNPEGLSVSEYTAEPSEALESVAAPKERDELPSNEVLGEIRGPAGPIEGAEVTLYNDRATSPQTSMLGREFDRTLTDERGRFRFENPPGRGRYMLRASAEDLVSGRASGIDLSKPSTLFVRLTLQPGHVVSGTVRHAEGHPVSEARVLVYDESVAAFEPDDRLEKQGIVESDGTFTIKGVGSGLKSVLVTGPAFTRSMQYSVQVPERSTGLEFLVQDGLAIRGQIVYEGSNEAAEGVRISGFSRVGTRGMGRRDIVAMRSDETGHFELLGFPKGPVELVVQGSALRRIHRQTVDAGTQGLRFTVPRPCVVSGMVLDAETEQPLARASVAVVANPEFAMATIGEELMIKPENQGAFELGDLPAQDNVWIRVRAPERPDTTEGPFSLVPGSVVQNIIVRVGRGGAVTGIVCDPGGVPVEGALVEAKRRPEGAAVSDGHPFREFINEAHGKRRSATTAADGRFDFAGMDAGLWIFEIRHEEFFLDRPLRVRLQPGEQRELGKQVRLSPGGALRVQVIDAEGKPDPAARVQVSMVGASSPIRRTAATDKEGVATLLGLRPGLYTVITSQRNNMPDLGGVFEGMAGVGGPPPVQVAAGNTATMELRPPR